LVSLFVPAGLLPKPCATESNPSCGLSRSQIAKHPRCRAISSAPDAIALSCGKKKPLLFSGFSFSA
jgi:hypothetical protein